MSVHERAASGQPVPGIIATTNEQSIGGAINDILMVAEHVSEREMKEHVVVYLRLTGQR